MVAALLQVHHDVEQGHLVASTFGVQSLKVPGQYELVIFPAETVFWKDMIFFCFENDLQPLHHMTIL